MSYTFGNFVHISDGAENSIGQSVPAMNRPHYQTVNKRPPSLAQTKKSATIDHRGRRDEKVRGVIITSPADEEVSSSEIPNAFYLSDASGIAATRQISHRVVASHRVGVVDLPQSEPNDTRGFTRASVSHSADNLLSHAGAASDGFSSDEGEMVGECFICYNAFDEDFPDMTPRNLRCGHAFCTGEEEQSGAVEMIRCMCTVHNNIMSLDTSIAVVKADSAYCWFHNTFNISRELINQCLHRIAGCLSQKVMALERACTIFDDLNLQSSGPVASYWRVQNFCNIKAKLSFSDFMQSPD